MSDFYTESDLKYLEKAVLLEDIILPELPKFPTMEEIHAGKVYYPRTEELYNDVVGKFSIPITTPLNENYSDPVDKKQTNKPIKNMSASSGMKSSQYESSNYIELTIPKFVALNFINKIPKGTEFIAGFIGGGTDLSDIKIIGVYAYV